MVSETEKKTVSELLGYIQDNDLNAEMVLAEMYNYHDFGFTPITGKLVLKGGKMFLKIDKKYWGGEEGDSVFRWFRVFPLNIVY